MIKHILYITTSYTIKNSSAAIRNNGLVKGLLALGYSVDVYTISWSDDMTSPFWLSEANGDIYTMTLPRLRMINLMKKKTLSGNKKGFLTKMKKLVKSILFFPDTTSQWIKLFPYEEVRNKQYDIMITSSDHKTSHFVGMTLKKYKPDLEWLQIWGDPWSTDVNTPYLMRKITAYYEKSLLARANKVVYVSKPTMNYIINTYPLFSNKIYYVPRSYYFECSDIDFNRDGKIHIVYTGTISFGRNIMPLVEAINKHSQLREKISLDIYGNYDSEIWSMLCKYNFVNQNDSVDFKEISRIYASASLLVYLSNKKGSSQIPGKLYDYLGTSSPILCLVEDQNDQISIFLKKLNRCIIIHNDTESIYKEMEMIVNSLNNRFKPEIYYSSYSIAKQIMEVAMLD